MNRGFFDNELHFKLKSQSHCKNDCNGHRTNIFYSIMLYDK